VHAYSGMEKAVERNLRERIDRAGMQDKFGRILVPTEEVVELKNGKKSRHRAPLLPGLCAGRDADGRRHLAPGQAHQQGHRLRRWRAQPPGPISEAEVMKIVNQMQEGVDKPRPKVEWMVGELVRVKEGPFTDFNGAVEEVNYEKSKVASRSRSSAVPRGRAGLRAGREGLRRCARWTAARRRRAKFPGPGPRLICRLARVD
jgi:transcriptional antiterminator NusG